MSLLGVVTNPAAASGRGAAPGAQALATLAAHGHQVIDLTRATWREARDAAQAVVSDLDALVVVGGDGMVHLGLQVCGERSLPLGIVAAGSGNDFAATLGLPVRDVEAAVRIIHESLTNPASRLTIDLGVATDATASAVPRSRYFAGVLSAGIDAAIAARGMRMRFPRGTSKYKVAIGLEPASLPALWRAPHSGRPRLEGRSVHPRRGGQRHHHRRGHSAVPAFRLDGRLPRGDHRRRTHTPADRRHPASAAAGHSPRPPRGPRHTRHLRGTRPRSRRRATASGIGGWRDPRARAVDGALCSGRAARSGTAARLT
nr:diacylglycerol kinase family protein [Demequina litorisediminis]